MTDLDFHEARIDVSHTEFRDVFTRWRADLTVPLAGDSIGALESAHFAMTRDGAIRKARRKMLKLQAREASREVIKP